MALCSLPRTNPGDQHQYKRVNGPVLWESTIELGQDFFNEITRHPVPLDILSRTGEYKLPFGTLPRLLVAWVSTEG